MTANDGDNALPLTGDEFISDPRGQLTHAIDIQAQPEDIWPWLVQMGCGRAGWYSYDILDNANARSDIHIRSDLQDLKVGDILPATPTSDDGFEVIALDPPNAMVLGGLFVPGDSQRHNFHDPRPDSFWHVTWAFVLERLDDANTRLRVRARAAYSADLDGYAGWMARAHGVMEQGQLRGIKARAEKKVRRDGWRDVVDGLVGGAGIALNLLTPFLRGIRSHWGLDKSLAERDYPGDELIPEPKWGWTHAVEVNATAEDIWGWIAQIGAYRGGFYSYQWLENLIGCDVDNATEKHPDWQHHVGSSLVLHPDMPPLRVTELKRNRYFVALGDDLDGARTTWLFFLEPVFADRTRVVSRCRFDYPQGLSASLKFGPYVTESIGFVMDRRMLLGIKGRAEGH